VTLRRTDLVILNAITKKDGRASTLNIFVKV
jgi:hypothetical protein